ncbi:MAG: outer membrane lipoprotein carrier protein LolA [Bacteroidota bacterium]
MKKTSILILSIILFQFAMAQVTDNTAKGILDKVANKNKAYSSIKIDFTYSLQNPKTKTNESKKGTLYMKGKKVRLEMSGQTIINDGKTVWTYIADAEEVTINNFEENAESISPTSLLTNYNKNFKPKYIKDSKKGAKIIQIIDLTPIKGNSYYKVRLEIDKNSLQIESSTVYDKNGSTYTYMINKMTTNTLLDDQKFIFKKSDFPKAEINDLR